VANGVSRGVYVDVMLVRYTYDDINAIFGHWSMKLRKHDYSTIPLLMKSFMDAELLPLILHLIEEVLDFKGFIDSSICKKKDAFEGHIAMQQFKFDRNANGWLLMQYKLYYIDPEWLPKEDG
jgi:hypothetical protein